MTEYVLTVFAVLLVVSAILLYIMKRYKILDFSLVASIFITSLILSLGFPFFTGIFGVLTVKGNNIDAFQLLLVFIFLVIAYAALTFIISVVISNFVSDAAVKQFAGKIAKTAFYIRLSEIYRKIPTLKIKPKLTVATGIPVNGNADSAGCDGTDKASNEQETPLKADNYIQNKAGEGALSEDSAAASEKSVDSRQIIDTMGIETGEKAEKTVQSYVRIPRNAISDQLVMFDDSDSDTDEITWVRIDDDDDVQPAGEQPLGEQPAEEQPAEEKPDEQRVPEAAADTSSNSADAAAVPKKAEITEIAKDNDAATDKANNSDSGKTLQQLIDDAFTLKANGQFEEAISGCMHALGMGPDKELAFWLALDICVMYKALGQKELARDILQSYLLKYGEVMDSEIKGQIEVNLFELDNT